MSGLVDVEVLSYIRPDDGFRKYMLDMAPVRCEFLFDAQLVLSRNSHPTGFQAMDVRYRVRVCLRAA